MIQHDPRRVLRIGMFDVGSAEDGGGGLVLGPESGWTVQKLASTLSCGERFTHIKQVVVATLRRTLCYPLYRNFRLALAVWDDVSALLLSQALFLDTAISLLKHKLATIFFRFVRRSSRTGRKIYIGGA